MFFVLTKRVVRFARDVKQGDRFAARHQNRESWTVSGPFVKRVMADKAALGAMATHTCLSAQVMSVEQLHKLSEASSFEQTDYELRKAVSNAMKYLS